jgi:hypothetical protein
MVVAQQPSGQMMTALKECRRQAQKCVDESIKAPSATLRSGWLALAEDWVRTAERVAGLQPRSVA